MGQTPGPPPPPPPPPPEAPAFPNDSGTGPTAVAPPEIRKWNWGAFLLSWIWGLGNRVYIALLTIIPLVGLVMVFVLGAKGNEWAWQKKRWDSVEHFKRVQRKWAIAGLIYFVVATTLAVAGMVFSVVTTSGERQMVNDANSIELTLPDGWTKASGLNEEADIEAQHMFKELYTIVLIEPTGALPGNVDLRRYATFGNEQFLNTMTEGGIVSGPTETSGESGPGIQYEMEGTVDGIEVAYLMTYYETDTHLVRVIAWATASEYDTHKAELQAVTESVELI